tara:strand:- start:1147 stop:1761 length:615 start_codon:yes stop_codon:yes gene_type:complete
MNNLQIIKELGIKQTGIIKKLHKTYTEPGSLNYLLYGRQPSLQSLNIKFGRVGEIIAKKMIELSPHLELLQCGCHVINDNGKKKDLDLLWANHNEKKIFYRELKGNIELDTEKLPAMISKINDVIVDYIKSKYNDYIIDIGILNWSVYDRTIFKKSKCLTHIKKCEKKNIKVDHMNDFMQLINFQWDKEDFYSYFKELGIILNH